MIRNYMIWRESSYDLNKVRKNEERRKRISIEVVWVDGHSSMSGYGWSPANQEYNYRTSRYTYKS